MYTGFLFSELDFSGLINHQYLVIVKQDFLIGDSYFRSDLCRMMRSGV
jgi:hypothetical protein